MELVTLEIKGFRGFKNKQIINFPKDKQPVVFVGVNGAGKTSILDAIRLGLHPFYNGLLNSGVKTGSGVYNINTEKENMAISLDWKYLNESDSQIFQTEVKVNRLGSPTSSASKQPEVVHLISDIKNNVSSFKNQYSLGIMVYYPSDRLVAAPEMDDQASNQSLDQFSALINASVGSIDFKTFFHWFRLTEDIENEKRLTEDSQYTEPKLQAVKNAILAFLDDFSDLRIQRSPFADMVIKKKGQKLSVNQLSSGEKSLLTMVGDLARRLAIANPGLPNPLNGRAVVLIDEVDLHLHPKWQKEIVARLQDTFPNVQFILSTHSTLVINHLKTESIFLLDNFECYPAKQTKFVTYGADLAKLLAWQGLEGGSIPKKIAAEINIISKLILENELEEAKKLLTELKQSIDPHHSEIKNIETQLELKELGL
jgi:predicted ATP-binding protein involved in virulence